jgi:hypothetical protein
VVRAADEAREVNERRARRRGTPPAAPRKTRTEWHHRKCQDKTGREREPGGLARLKSLSQPDPDEESHRNRQRRQIVD